jgi:uroporphyrin-III C-methyltransferase
MKKVYLVGAGPGDPELITVKGMELLKKADTIIYDRLGAGGELLKHAKPGAEMIYVGKKSGEHTIGQEKINQILVKKAMEGKLVVRLKGGDPFIFGRGGEEVMHLVKHGIEYEIVPGITSPIALPALAGIPLTDRRYSSSFTVVTGQMAKDKKKKVGYAGLRADTVIILMGVKNLPYIIKEMLKSRKAETPVAIIEKGTTSKERTIITTLGEAAEVAKRENVKPPAVTVIGEVVKLRKEFGKG